MDELHKNIARLVSSLRVTFGTLLFTPNVKISNINPFNTNLPTTPNVYKTLL
jgi:hypothetical protein